ncbi:hypothetical protein FA15DRAFT_311089 [Coprinopsis marcescibilis]|uniref:Nephrocystin 3-like N-terminal domain-containing protein n=1 Tax=Coprinopsis marcescibilis TaxID=230819 RepID=A0A5C3L019_COPMA|nr:hypothetical protein FA15DRAFT_311089 [Coprinopsis marcescibilis]
MPFFPNSSGVEVLGSTLVDNSSNVYINVQTERTERDDISALLKFVAPEAIQDDKEREDAPRCKEDTRQEVLTDILQWLRRPYGGEDPTDILWLTGFMGTGKTAIAQTLAEACAEEKTLAAVFFFSYRLQKSNNHSRLIPTLAYQLTLKIPRAKRFIIDAVSRDPLHPRKNLRSQMESLILQPLEQARQEKPGEKWPNTIIIDGLDECEDEVQQAAVLKLIHECLETGRFPFRVVIASRREKEIREYFEGKGRQRTRQIDLGSYDANPDIELFLRQSFADKHAKDESGSPWPSNEDIDALVRMSSGQFVFASMVLKYVNDPTSYHSESHLQEVLALSSKRNGSSESLAPFTPLDELYASILNKSPSPSESALAIVIISKLSSLHWRPVFASEANRLLESRSNECKRLFDRLHSILFVPLPDQVSTSSYRVYHKSLVDFLTDRRPFRREIQKNLYVPDVVVHTAICKRYLNMYARKPFSLPMTLPQVLISLQSQQQLPTLRFHQSALLGTLRAQTSRMKSFEPYSKVPT